MFDKIERVGPIRGNAVNRYSLTVTVGGTGRQYTGLSYMEAQRAKTYFDGMSGRHVFSAPESASGCKKKFSRSRSSLKGRTERVAITPRKFAEEVEAGETDFVGALLNNLEDGHLRCVNTYEVTNETTLIDKPIDLSHAVVSGLKGKVYIPHLVAIGIDIRDSNIRPGSKLREADFERGTLTNVRIDGADMANVDFEEVDAKYLDIRNSDLTAADLSRMDVTHGNFFNCQLKYAYTAGIVADGTRFRDCDTLNAYGRVRDFKPAKLYDVRGRGITPEQFLGHASTMGRVKGFFKEQSKEAREIFSSKSFPELMNNLKDLGEWGLIALGLVGWVGFNVATSDTQTINSNHSAEIHWNYSDGYDRGDADVFVYDENGDEVLRYESVPRRTAARLESDLSEAKIRERNIDLPENLDELEETLRYESMRRRTVKKSNSDTRKEGSEETR